MKRGQINGDSTLRRVGKARAGRGRRDEVELCCWQSSGLPTSCGARSVVLKKKLRTG